MDDDRRHSTLNRTKIKDIIAFWIFGLCNNFGFVVMLTAAEDLLKSKNVNTENFNRTGRNCTVISTGAILLADIIPAFTIKLLSPFLPYNTRSRVIIACFTSAFSFLLVATASSTFVVILGVIMTSFSSGLGEPTFLYHSTYYDKNTISSWSSGTGAAGVIGGLSYAILRQFGFSNYITLALMITVPLIEFTIFATILSSPMSTICNFDNNFDENSQLIQREINPQITRDLTIADKLILIPSLLVYIVPLSFVYFFEYYINQGLFEIIVFENSFLTKEQQYHWYQVTYQIGVFIARSSVNIIKIKHTWIMAIVQGVIALFFTFEAVFNFIPGIWMVIPIILIEGFQGGLAYVNTFYRINQEASSEIKTYAMNMVALSDSFGIIFAGFFAIFVHNLICS